MDTIFGGAVLSEGGSLVWRGGRYPPRTPDQRGDRPPLWTPAAGDSTPRTPGLLVWEASSLAVKRAKQLGSQAATRATRRGSEELTAEGLSPGRRPGYLSPSPGQQLRSPCPSSTPMPMAQWSAPGCLPGAPARLPGSLAVWPVSQPGFGHPHQKSRGPGSGVPGGRCPEGGPVPSLVRGAGRIAPAPPHKTTPFTKQN